jgi:hypothetical protein
VQRAGQADALRHGLVDHPPCTCTFGDAAHTLLCDVLSHRSCRASIFDLATALYVNPPGLFNLQNGCGSTFMVGADHVPGTAHGYYRLATSPALCRGRGLRPQLEVRSMAAAVYLRWLKLGYEHFTEKVAQQFKASDRPKGNQWCAIDDDWPCGRLCGHWRYHSLALLSSHQTALNLNFAH